MLTRTSSLSPGAGVLDLVALRGLHAVLRRVLRGGARLHPLDDHRRALLPGPEARGHVRGRAYQLVCKLSSSNRISNNAGTKLSSYKNFTKESNLFKIYF